MKGLYVAICSYLHIWIAKRKKTGSSFWRWYSWLAIANLYGLIHTLAKMMHAYWNEPKVGIKLKQNALLHVSFCNPYPKFKVFVALLFIVYIYDYACTQYGRR